jgi:hypothetical protein
MTVKVESVRITNEHSLGGLILDVADFLRDQAEQDSIFEVYNYNNLFNEKRHFTLREVE